MKIRPHRLFLASLVLSFAGAAHAATIQWVGDADANFANGANWETDPDLPSLSSDTWQINTEGDFGTTLFVDSDPLTEGNQPLAFTGTAGKIAFGASAPAMTLTGGDLSFVNSTNDTILLGTDSTVTQIVQNNLVLGDGANSTISITNQSITGGLLKVTGNITGGTGALTPGNLTFSLGSTGSNNGNYEVTGNIAKGGAAAVNITKRGSGILTLSGINDLATTLGQNETGSTIVINGGKTSIASNSVNTGWGGNTVASLIKITGGELYAKEAAFVRSKLEIDGGTLTIGDATTESSLGFNNQATNVGEVFTLKSGKVDIVSSKTGGYTKGFILATGQASASISGAQTGGDFLVNGRTAVGQVFTLGNSTVLNTTTGYSLSGGLLDLKGQTGILGFLQINAEATGSSTTTFTLSGTGKLISRFNPGATSGGIVGGVVGGVQVLSLQGGTLVAGRVDAANLRGPNLGDTVGTIVNNGSTIAPGDAGFSGKTTVSGNLAITTGSLAFDIGGTTASTAWKDAASSGKHDKLTATGSGAVVLGGTLNVSLIDSFVPTNADVFYILDGPGGVSGTFTNLIGGRIILTGGDSFAVTIDGTSVFLSNYQPAGGGGNTFASWIGGFDVGGLTGANDDFDNDGLDNAVENVLGSNPSVYSEGLTQVSAAAGSFKFRHNESNAIASDVTKSYEWSTDLVEWKSSGQSNTGGTIATITTSVITDTVAPATDVIEVTVSVTGSPAKVFGRLVATKAP
jgi:hypothetical protein